MVPEAPAKSQQSKKKAQLRGGFGRVKTKGYGTSIAK